ncbi:MAG TPA: hypothetical protein VIG86_08065 [Candidatus Dormibacteraeota bacterium]
MRAACSVAILVVAATAGCATAMSAATLQAVPATYLLTLDQLVAPDFSVDTPAHALSITTLAAGDAPRASELATAGFTGAAAVDFFRAASNLAVVNGPVQIGDTVAEFASAAGAAVPYGSDIARLDAIAGAVAISTGSLGDAAHATSRVLTDPNSGVRVVEITVEWRVDNLLDILVVRGRDGGTRPDDALLLAHRQTAIELGLATPTPLQAVTGSPSAH